MNKDNITSEDIKKFFDNPFSKEYSEYCGESMLSVFTQITAVLQYAIELVPATKKESLEKSSESLMLDLAKLLRIASVSRTLARNELKMEAVDIDGVISFICREFAERFGEDKFVFNFKSNSRAYIYTDVNVFLELILGALRKMALSHRCEKYEFDIAAEVADGRVRLFIIDSTKDEKKKKTVPVDEELFDGFFEELGTVLCDMIGATFSFNGRMCRFELPEYAPDEAILLSSPVRFHSDEIKKFCDIMLKDENF